MTVSDKPAAKQPALAFHKKAQLTLHKAVSNFNPQAGSIGLRACGALPAQNTPALTLTAKPMKASPPAQMCSDTQVRLQRFAGEVGTPFTDCNNVAHASSKTLDTQC